MLLSLENQNKIKPIVLNWANQKKVVDGLTNYEQLASEVESKELVSLLGYEFLQDLQANRTEPKNKILLEGGTFDNGVTFKGLNFVIAYFNYARFVGVSPFSESFTGVVKKNREESQSLANGEVKRLQTDARDIAMMEWELIKRYLNCSDYPYWNSQIRKPFIPRFKGVKRTLR